MKKIITFAAALICTALVLFFVSQVTSNIIATVPERPEFKDKLIMESVIGYHIGRNKTEVIYLTSDKKYLNVYSYSPTENKSKKLNISPIPLTITVNNNMLGFAPSYMDTDGVIYFRFGELLQISNEGEVAVYDDYEIKDGKVNFTKQGGQKHSGTLTPSYDLDLPVNEFDGVTLLDSDTKYKISDSHPAHLEHKCYLRLFNVGDSPSCNGYRLLLYKDKETVVLPNYETGEENSKYDSGFVYIPTDKNLFLDDGSFVFLSQTNKLYIFE